MLKPEAIQSLKKVSVTKNPEATKARIRALWQPLEKSKRAEILELAKLKKTAIEKAYRDGAVTARVAMAMAQVLGIDPNYLTGAVDEPGVFSNDIAKEFLTALGYDIKKLSFSRKPRTPKPVEADITEQEEQEEQGPSESDKLIKSIQAMRDKTDGLSPEDAIQLLQSLAIQANYSEERKTLYDLIKCILLQ